MRFFVAIVKVREKKKEWGARSWRVFFKLRFLNETLKTEKLAREGACGEILSARHDLLARLHRLK